MPLQDLNAYLEGRLPLVWRDFLDGGVESALDELPQAWHRSEARAHLEPTCKPAWVAAEEIIRELVVFRMPSIRDSDGARCQFWRHAV